MPIYKGSTKIDALYKGANISKVYKGGTLVFQNKLPAGTVLFEQHGTDGGGGVTTYELTLPTTQTVEIVIVGGGGPVVGYVNDT